MTERIQAAMSALTVVYFVGVGLLLLRILIGLGIACRLWRRSEPVSHEARVRAAAGFLGGATKVRWSRDLATPVTIGSTVLLPADYALWDEAKMRVVLAHERSHVRQGDFYLQLLAAVHAAFFWFSPLGWWLQRKLSELGEALGDRAGLEQAASPACYAQILLEFAAMPRGNRFTNPLAHTLAGPLTGVAMARSSNLSSRIERILNGRRFRLAFLSGGRHAVLAAVLVPALLVAVVACIRIVPAVEAGQSGPVIGISSAAGTQNTGVVAGQDRATASQDKARTDQDKAAAGDSGQDKATTDQDKLASGDSGQETKVEITDETKVEITDETKVEIADETTGQMRGEMREQVTSTESDDSAQRVVSFQDPSASQSSGGSGQSGSSSDKTPGESSEHESRSEAGFAYGHGDGDDDSFAIVSGNKSTITMSGQAGKDLERARQKVHGDFIWFERDGKSYVVTDPAIVAAGQRMFKADPSLSRIQEQLEKQQAILDKKMKDLEPEIAKASQPGPEFAEKMAKLEQQLSALKSDEYKNMSEQIAKAVNEHSKVTDEMIREITQEKLSDLQGKIGDIQGQIGEIQGSIGEREGLLGEKQGKIGEEMGKLGEQMGKLGEEQGRKAEEASRKLKSMLDQAFREGKAKPVE